MVPLVHMPSKASVHSSGSASINYEPECDKCGQHFHLMDDPVNAYNGKGITCSKCGKTGKNELIGDDYYYQCSDCQMTDLCSKCYVMSNLLLSIIIYSVFIIFFFLFVW